MLRQLDIPPLWLGLALWAAWGLSDVWLVEGFHWLGVVVMLAGLALMAAALWTMMEAKTSFVPRRDPQALVTTGVFGWSRNPIYLADALILTGAVLWWGGLLALTLVPLFMGLITFRFIRDEEARLRAGFGPAYEAWAARVPRWIWRF
jgi:protein-S-isoprenylcysteine O-methyltransferase Ste14